LKLFHCKKAFCDVVICNTFPCCVAWAVPETTLIPCGPA